MSDQYMTTFGGEAHFIASAPGHQKPQLRHWGPDLLTKWRPSPGDGLLELMSRDSCRVVCDQCVDTVNVACLMLRLWLVNSHSNCTAVSLSCGASALVCSVALSMLCMLDKH